MYLELDTYAYLLFFIKNLHVQYIVMVLLDHKDIAKLKQPTKSTYGIV